MKKLFFMGLLLAGAGLHAQVMVNDKDLNTTAQSFEVYLMAKPFSSKESIFANSGTNDFKIANYDTKKQSIFNAEGKKFEKGEYLNLQNYLTEQGWEEGTSRPFKNGNQTGTVITYKRKKA